MTGTNIGTGNFVDPVVLRTRGYRLIRLVSLPEAESYAQQCRDIGIAVVAVVIPAQSHGYVMGNADVYQFDNERDLDQSPADYVEEATFYQRTYPHLAWISCGMASGRPAWWKEVQTAGGLQGFSGYAVHPYNKTPDEAAALLDQYKRLTPSMDLWVTEWARPAAQIPRFQFMLRTRAVHDLYFCEDCGVPGFQAPPLILERS